MSIADQLYDEPPQTELGFDLDERAKLPHNDMGNGQRMAAAHGEEMRYVIGRGWIVWNGMIWDQERGEIAAFRMAGDLQRLIEDEAAAAAARPVPQAQIDAMVAEKGVDHDAAERSIKAARKKAVMTFAKGCGNAGRMDNALKVARGFLPAAVADFDAQPWRLTVKNGELDLLALAAERPEAEDDDERDVRWRAALHPFRRETFATRMAGAHFRPGEDCPVWKDFMCKAIPDPAMRSYAQRLAGYLLSGVNDAQICIVLLGGGGNGKSTWANAMDLVMGGYGATCPIEMFLEAKNVNAAAASPQEAVLPGARAYFASEPENNATLSTSRVKGLTGGEKRQSRALRGDPFEWEPNGVPVLSFNRLPRITDESEGMWRRLMFLPWDVFLPGLPPEARRSPAEMSVALRAEASGVLNWMIEGWIAFRAIGLCPPPEVLELKRARRALADPVGEFLGECVEMVAGERLQAKTLFDIYEVWCDGAGAAPLSMPRFKKMLIDKGFGQVKSGGLNMWLGMRWAATPDVDALIKKHEAAEQDDAWQGR